MDVFHINATQIMSLFYNLRQNNWNFWPPWTRFYTWKGDKSLDCVSTNFGDFSDISLSMTLKETSEKSPKLVDTESLYWWYKLVLDNVVLLAQSFSGPYFPAFGPNTEIYLLQRMVMIRASLYRRSTLKTPLQCLFQIGYSSFSHYHGITSKCFFLGQIVQKFLKSLWQ